MQKKLVELVPGQRGVIADLVGEADLVQRLLDMGVTDGETVELVRFAPLGDPLEIRVRGYNLSLRRSEAATVLVDDIR